MCAGSNVLGRALPRIEGDQCGKPHPVTPAPRTRVIRAMVRKALLSWSSGKDSCWTLRELRKNPDIEVVGLFTTFNSAFDRVAMHAVRRELVEKQADSLGLPLWSVELPWPCSNNVYESCMRPLVDRALSAKINAVAFGDLFLRDIRAYRERQLSGTGLEPMFPLWDLSTPQLAAEMIAGGTKAILTCIDPKKLDHSFAGRSFDSQFLRDLPASVDPCGENGEFHTFVYDGPGFRVPISVTTGETVERDGFIFADVTKDSAASLHPAENLILIKQIFDSSTWQPLQAELRSTSRQ